MAGGKSATGKGLIGMKLVGDGQYSGDGEKIDNALRFVLGLKSVNMIVVGFESPGQIDNYAERMQGALGEFSKRTLSGAVT